MGWAWLWMAALAGRAFSVERAPLELRLGYFPNLTHAQAL